MNRLTNLILERSRLIWAVKKEVLKHFLKDCGRFDSGLAKKDHKLLNMLSVKYTRV